MVIFKALSKMIFL